MSHLGEGIGIALDVRQNRMFVTDLAGSLYAARLDGSNQRLVAGGQGNLTGGLSRAFAAIRRDAGLAI